MLVATTALGQSKNDSTVIKKPSYLPTGIRVGTDLIGLIRSQTDDSFLGYEVNADVDFYRYFLAVEVGRWERSFLTDDEKYSNEGNYFRIGVDVNFLKKDPDNSMFFFGMRYGSSTYTENLTIINDPVWGPVGTTSTNADVHAGWGELTTGLRVRMLKFFWMGYTARYKFGLNINEPSGFESHDVPGYGKADNQATWGFNYQLLFRIPIRKQK